MRFELGRRYTFLLKELVRRDFRGRYAGSLLGILWSFAQPLWLLLLYSFAFGTVMKMSVQFGERGDSFAIWMFCGLLPWLAVQESVTRGATVITDNASLVKKLNFPSEILALSLVISALCHELIAASVFLLVLIVTGQAPGLSLVWVVPAMVIQACLTLGLVFLVASVHVIFRDMAQVLNMLLNAWFFLTPIVYSLEMVGDGLVGDVLRWNPLTTLVEFYRVAFLEGTIDSSLAWGIGRLVVLSIVVLWVGRAFYGRLKPSFPDLI